MSYGQQRRGGGDNALDNQMHDRGTLPSKDCSIPCVICLSFVG